MYMWVNTAGVNLTQASGIIIQIDVDHDGQHNAHTMQCTFFAYKYYNYNLIIQCRFTKHDSVVVVAHADICIYKMPFGI